MKIRNRIFATLIVVLLFSGTVYAQVQRYSVSYEKQPIEHVFKNLQAKTGYEFVYQKQVIQNVGSITVKCSDVTLSQLLNKVITETAGLDYEIVDKTVVVKSPTHRKTKYTITGHVFDNNGEPLPWAVIKVKEKGSSEGATTDMDGAFKLEVSHLPVTVEVSYLGYDMVTKTFKHDTNTRNVRIVMHESQNDIDEVIVTGYQVLNKRSLTSAVSMAKMEDLQRADMSSLDQMLEGRIPDLMVTSNSAEVGVAPKIRIRGTSTLIGNREPLWVVDGIVVNDPVQIEPEVLNDPDYVNRIGNAISGINPQDIDRIDVLKDAAATAIYGTKAANGVIVITTKRGSKGKPRVSYSISTTMKVRPRYSDNSVDVMSSKERIQFSRQLAQDHYQYNTNATLVGYEKLQQQLYNGYIDYNQFVNGVSSAEQQNTDWFDLLTQDSWSTQQTASVSGGSDNNRYYASIGYTDENDVVKANNNKRYTYSIKTDNTFSKLLTASFSFSGYHNTRDYYQDEIAPLQYAYTSSCVIPAYDSNGNYSYYQRRVDEWSEYNYNILNELDNSYKKQEVNSMTFTANLQFKFTDWLNANAILSMTHQTTDMEGWWGDRTNHIAQLRGSEYGATMTNSQKVSSTCPQGGELDKDNVRDNSYTARFQLNANKYLGEDEIHNIDAVFGLEISSDKYQGYSTVQRGYFLDRGKSFVSDINVNEFPGYATWLAGNVPSVIDNLTNEFSTYASFTYAYKSLWRINLNGRIDASNKFGDRSNERFLPIWSLSGSYDVGHWIDSEWIDYMTAKASYGFQGNMLDTESPAMTIRKGSMSSYYNEYTSTVVNHPNPDLKWEKTSSYNLGLDMSFFDHRLAVEASVYYKKTKDAFMNKNVSTVNGVSSYVINGGDVTNKGYSFDITATPIRNKNFRWTLSTTISKVINSVDSRPDSQTYELTDFLNGTALVQGKSVNTFYSYKFLGLSPIDGSPLFDDYFDNPMALVGLSRYDTYTTVLEASGKREADIQGSLTNTFRYKNWYASLTLGYSFGAKTRLFAMYGSAASNGAYGSEIYPEKNYSRDYLSAWRSPGDEKYTNIPALIGYSSDAYTKYSSVWTSLGDYEDNVYPIANSYWDMYDYSNIRVVSADYLKLQSFSLTYELDKKQLDRIGFSRVALTLAGYNLFTICDPALKGQTPTQGGFSTIQLSDRPSFSFTLNIQF